MLDQSDRPRDAATITIGLRHLDIVALASDGFWDNVFPAELEQLCRLCLAEHDESKPDGLDDLARKLAEACCSVAAMSARSDRRTPFQIGAEAAGRPDWTGGKIDDCSVAIAIAVDDPMGEAVPLV